MVDFGDTCTGKYFSGDNPHKPGCVPIKPMLTIFLTYSLNVYVKHTPIQIPLKLSWGLAVRKAPGGKFKEKHCINLGTIEVGYGLTYVALRTAKN